MNPILFLDFDGVTHPEACTAAQLFCGLPLIEEVLLRHPRVEIVISSSWREHRGLQELQGHFSPALRERVVGCTPVYRQDPCEPAQRYVREIECTSWLQSNRPSALWLALDDNPRLFRKGCPNLLAIDGRVSFTAADALRLDARLQPMQPVLQQAGGLQ